MELSCRLSKRTRSRVISQMGMTGKQTYSLLGIPNSLQIFMRRETQYQAIQMQSSRLKRRILCRKMNHHGVILRMNSIQSLLLIKHLSETTNPIYRQLCFKSKRKTSFHKALRLSTLSFLVFKEKPKYKTKTSFTLTDNKTSNERQLSQLSRPTSTNTMTMKQE